MNKSHLETKGFYINFTGDRSVGISDAEWKLTGDFIFEGEAEYESFCNDLLNAFEWVSDTPIGIQTIEDREEELKREEEIFNPYKYSNQSENCEACGGSGEVEGEHYDDLHPCRNC